MASVMSVKSYSMNVRIHRWGDLHTPCRLDNSMK